MSSKNLRPATTYPAVVGYVLAWHRERLGLNQGDVAQRLALSASTLSRIERGESACTMDQLARVSEVLRMQPGQLLRDADSVARQLEKQGVRVERSRVVDPVAAGLALLAGVVLLAVVASELGGD